MPKESLTYPRIAQVTGRQKKKEYSHMVRRDNGLKPNTLSSPPPAGPRQMREALDRAAVGWAAFLISFLPPPFLCMCVCVCRG